MQSNLTFAVIPYEFSGYVLTRPLGSILIQAKIVLMNISTCFIHTYIHSFIHDITLHYTNTYIHTYTDTYMHAYFTSFPGCKVLVSSNDAGTRKYELSYTDTRTYTYICKDIYLNIDMNIYIYIHAYVHIHIDAHTHTHQIYTCI